MGITKGGAGVNYEKRQRDYRRSTDCLTIHDLYVSYWQKQQAKADLEAKIVVCAILVTSFLVVMAFIPGPW